jgi:hypothetical protein
MVRCKNAGGAPSDGDESPPHLTEVAYDRGSGIHIGERRFHLEGRQLSTEATEEIED